MLPAPLMMSPLQPLVCGVHVPVLPAQLQPVAVGEFGLPGSAATFHELQVMAGLHTCEPELHEAVVQSLSATHA